MGHRAGLGENRAHTDGLRFGGPPRGSTDFGFESSEARPKRIPGGGLERWACYRSGAALEPWDAVPSLKLAQAASNSPCSRIGRRARNLAESLCTLFLAVAKAGEEAQGGRGSSSLLRAGTSSNQTAAARAVLRPPLLRNRPASPDRPHPGGPAVSRQQETLLQLEGVHGFPALWSAGLLLGEGRAQDAPGNLALPWRRDHVMPRLPLGLCPYMEVATWPGVRAAWGGAPARGGRGERRWAGTLLGEQNSLNGSQGPRPAFFYLLWCCSHHPVLIGQRGTSGRRVRGKNLHIFPPS